MKLPDDLKLRETMHGSGANGMAHYTYEDTAGLGVVLQVRRERVGKPFREHWRFMWLPERVFATWSDLAAGLAPLTDEAIAAEKAKWPQLGTVTDLADSPNRCMRHRDRPGVIQASVATCWIPGQGLVASLCEECRGAASGNGQGVVEIMEERRQRVAAMKPPLQMLMESQKP